MRATSGGSPLETLVRLFVIGSAVDERAAREALAPMTLDAWCQAGLARVQGGEVMATVHLLPIGELLIASDFAHAPSTQRADAVMGVTGSTLFLNSQTVRRRVRRTLDLGTGCGIQAICASRHSGRVYGTDTNPRALAFTSLNTRLNDVDNVELRSGSLFKPVRNLRFDLIVCNPPFGVGPDERYLYRDNGMEEDRFAQTLVRQAPGHLSEGGYCQIICDWVHNGQGDWKQRLSAWFEGSGCDVWVMRRSTSTPHEYVMYWMEDDLATKEKAGRYDRWIDYYERRGIRALSFGAIMMRRRSSGATWFHADDYEDPRFRPSGEDLLRGFDARDFLHANQSDEALLMARLKVMPDVRLEQQCVPGPGRWHVRSAQLQRVRGLTFSNAVDGPTAQFVALCDGSRRVKDIIQQMSSRDPGPGRLAQQLLPVVRRLVARAILEPA